MNPFEGHLFVFLGRRLDRVKVLVWDRNGFVLYYKRLSQGRFRMPKVPEGATRVELDATTLAMLLDGIDVKYVRRPTPWDAAGVASRRALIRSTEARRKPGSNSTACTSRSTRAHVHDQRSSLATTKHDCRWGEPRRNASR